MWCGVVLWCGVYWWCGVVFVEVGLGLGGLGWCGRETALEWDGMGRVDWIEWDGMGRVDWIGWGEYMMARECGLV